ncbi:MAG: ATP-dependent helicase, partial [Lentisphaerae bacterium]|nr:ATP-dependent helicase [Lentisphaerota bacterium]
MFENKNIYDPTRFATNFRIREELLTDLRTKIKESSFDSSEALSSYRTVADEFQAKVIEAKDRTIRMLAPAGSGKTQTIVNRVLSNIRNGCNPDRILVLTFDNAAASALTSNLNNQLNQARVSLGSLPCMSTVNAYGYSILREYVPREYMPVAEENARRWIVRDIKRQLERIGADIFATLPDNLTGSYYLEFFSLLKNELFDPRKFNQQAIADFIIEHGGNTLFTSTEERYVRLVVQGMIWVFEKYDMELREKRRLDFDDQKLRSYLAMRNDRNLLSRLQGKFDEVIVDEFQDINRLEFVFIETLSGKSKLVVVGDDDQAIYGFRGCKPDFIINLESHLRRPVASYELSVNYRCPPNIVEHATKLINHNSSRVPKTPIANRKDRASIEVLSTVSADVEAKVVVDYIRRVIQDNLNLKFNDFAILYRTNAQSLPLQVELISNNIPYYVRDKDKLQKNETLILMLGVFRLKRAINNNRRPLPEDAVRTVCAYFRYMNPVDVRKLRTLF